MELGCRLSWKNKMKNHFNVIDVIHNFCAHVLKDERMYRQGEPCPVVFNFFLLNYIYIYILSLKIKFDFYKKKIFE
jgi:hypothetical protein